MANGDTVPTMGTIDLPLTIDGLTFRQTFTIAEIDAPAVIGYNFLHNNNCSMNLGSSTLIIEGKQIACKKQSQIASVFNIKMHDKIVVPGNSEIIINGKVDGDSSHIMNALVEPLMSKHTNNLLVARALVDPSTGNVPLRIANITNEDQILHRSTCTALCENIDLDLKEMVTEKISQLTSFDNDETSDDLQPHLIDLYERSCKILDPHQMEDLKCLLAKHSGTFFKIKI